MAKYTLFRDDDISVTSNIVLLRQVHDLFLKHNKIHTVAVLMDRLWENKEIWYWLMTAKNLRVGLHGWTHIDYGRNTEAATIADIRQSLAYWNSHYDRGKNVPPLIDTFYPPWNSVSAELESACAATGLTLDARMGGEVFNFHYWSCQDAKYMKQLEEALRG